MNTLTLYFIPSPKGIDWTTPTTLARTIVTNKLAFKKRFMGHVNIELKYEEGEKKVHLLTGMTTSSMNSLSLLFLKKSGLGILFNSFPGKLEDKDELIPELNQYLKEGNKSINFVQYEVSNEVRDVVKDYLTYFKTGKLEAFYGLYNCPLEGEGAGCSGFGASIMEVTGFMTSEIKKAWSRCLRVPHKLAGFPLTKSKISFVNLFLKKHDWAKETEDNTEIFFYDPDLMYKWVEEERKKAKTIKIKNTEGLFFDKKEIKNIPNISFKTLKSKEPDLTTKTNKDKLL